MKHAGLGLVEARGPEDTGGGGALQGDVLVGQLQGGRRVGGYWKYFGGLGRKPDLSQQFPGFHKIRSSLQVLPSASLLLHYLKMPLLVPSEPSMENLFGPPCLR